VKNSHVQSGVRHFCKLGDNLLSGQGIAVESPHAFGLAGVAIASRFGHAPKIYFTK
jgi:hypothetical protein